MLPRPTNLFWGEQNYSMKEVILVIFRGFLSPSSCENTGQGWKTSIRAE